jgi:hypothetical protein
MQCDAQLKSDGDTTPRKREDHTVGGIPIVPEFLSKVTPRFFAVAKFHPNSFPSLGQQAYMSRFITQTPSKNTAVTTKRAISHQK